MKNKEKTDSVVIEVTNISKNFRVYEKQSKKDCSGNKNEKEELLRRS